MVNRVAMRCETEAADLIALTNIPFSTLYALPVKPSKYTGHILGFTGAHARENTVATKAEPVSEIEKALKRE